MKYEIQTSYCWYNGGEQLVLMYFINHVPFTFDDVPESLWYDKEVLDVADNERRYEPEDLYKTSFYLIDEECHPMMFELDLVNPEMLPQE